MNCSRPQPEFFGDPDADSRQPGDLRCSRCGETSWHPTASDGDRDEIQPTDAKQWPEPIHPAALTGLAGEFVRLVEPHTEADLNAILILFLAAFGNMAGPGAHFIAQGSCHTGRIWPVLVGETAGGRKGSAWATVRTVLKQVDEGWSQACVTGGISSGEGLIWAVRDPIQRERREKGRPPEMVVEDPGVSDKRLFAVEEEFSSVLKVAGRQGNTVSDILRKAWDTGYLSSLTKNSPARATGAHVTVTAHVTRADLKKHLAESDALNGFGNRFLWLAVRRSKRIPFGGALQSEDFSPLVLQLRRAVDHARKTGAIGFAEDARPLWVEAYNIMATEKSGLLGALTQRAEAQVVRLALIYAMLDQAPSIGVAHIQAALAVWDFCERSAAYIFGEAVGDAVADRILDELRSAGDEGLTGTEIHQLFHRNVSRQRLVEALTLLRSQGRVFEEKPSSGSRGGRPATRWRWGNEQNEQTTKFCGLFEAGWTKETNKPGATADNSFCSSIQRSEVRAGTGALVEEGAL